MKKFISAIIREKIKENPEQTEKLIKDFVRVQELVEKIIPLSWISLLGQESQDTVDIYIRIKEVLLKKLMGSSIFSEKEEQDLEEEMEELKEEFKKLAKFS